MLTIPLYLWIINSFKRCNKSLSMIFNHKTMNNSLPPMTSLNHILLNSPKWSNHQQPYSHKLFMFDLINQKWCQNHNKNRSKFKRRERSHRISFFMKISWDRAVRVLTTIRPIEDFLRNICLLLSSKMKNLKKKNLSNWRKYRRKRQSKVQKEKSFLNKKYFLTRKSW